MTKNIIDTNNYNADIGLLTSNPREVLELMTASPGRRFFIMTDVLFHGLGMNGIELGREIRKLNRDCHIVYITDHLEMMNAVLNSMVRPSGFYKKPVQTADLSVLIADIYRDYLNETENNESYFHVNIGSTMHRLQFDSIFYFEAFDKKIYIHTDNQRIGYYDSLSNIEKRLGDGFVRCHNSYIINKNRISRVSFTEMEIVMENGARVSISRTYKPVMKELLGS